MKIIVIYIYIYIYINYASYRGNVAVVILTRQITQKNTLYRIYWIYILNLNISMKYNL